MSEDRLDSLLGRVRDRAWTGPDRNDRVESFLKEQSMESRQKWALTRGGIVLIAAAFMGGGAVAAAVTHQVLARQAVLETEDGQRYHVELLDTPAGATGEFIADDGSVYHIRTSDGLSGEMQVEVDAQGLEDGTSTVIVEDGEG